MRSLESISLVAVAALASGLLVRMSNFTPSTPHPPLVGLYEYQPTVAQQADFSLSPLYLDWNDPQAISRLQSFLATSSRQQRLPLVTLEPFPDRAAGRTNADLLADVEGGRHDAAILAIGRTLAAHPGPLLVRFAHEMDQPGQYPWAFEDPGRYLRLYHYVRGKIVSLRPTNLHWVWSPIGSPRADRYWPGDQAVDVVGISVYASRRWSPTGRLESFHEILERQRWLQQRYRRPLLVAEAGVSGPPAEQQAWMREAIGSLDRFTEVCGLVYFHAPQPRWMPLPTGHEDWSLKPSVLRWFMAQLPLPPRQRMPCVEG